MDRQPEELTLDAVTRDAGNAFKMPLPDNASPELLVEAGRAIAHVYNNFDEYGAGFPGGDGKFQDHLYGVADKIAQKLGYTDEATAAKGYDITHGLGEFAPPYHVERDIHFEETPPRELFKDAGDEHLATSDNFRQRDLSEVINEMAVTAQMKDAPEHAAFKAKQANMGYDISREADPERRAEMRQEREAKAHDYAATLSDVLAGRALSAGQLDAAKDIAKLGDVHREIATELRGPNQPETTPPEPGRVVAPEVAFKAEATGITGQDDGPNRPQALAPESQDKAAAQFAIDAAAASGLGHTARTVHVEQFPGNDPNDIKGRAGGNDYSSLNTAEPEPQRPENAPNRAITIGMAPGGQPVIIEINQARPDVQFTANDDYEAEKQERERFEPTQSSKEEKRLEQEPASRSTAKEAPVNARSAVRAALAEVQKEAEGNDGAGLENANSGGEGRTASFSSGRS